MNEKTKPTPPVNQPPGNTASSESGVPELEQDINRSDNPAAPVPDDPSNPASKPQGTLQDQEKNMESEGQPVQPSDDAEDLPETTDQQAEREREAKLARDGSGF